MSYRKPEGFDKNNYKKPNSYQYERLRYYTKQRDGDRCKLCDNEYIEENECEVHHIYKQVDRPDLALDIDAVICLCENCHLSIVHSSENNHLQFASMFKKWINRKANKLYNQSIQPRLDKYKNKLGYPDV